jgi:hypothetical protein
MEVAMRGARWIWVLALGTAAACGGATDVSLEGPDGGGGSGGRGDASVTAGHPGSGGTGTGSGGSNGTAGAGGSNGTAGMGGANGTGGSMMPGPVGTVPGGGSCTSATECASLNCTGGVCGSACISDGQACGAGATCCSGTCNGGMCQALNNACKTGGNACTDNMECCSQLCTGGTCVLGSSYCIQQGDACVNSVDCCSGVCNVAQGAALGTCGAPASGASYCSGGVDGTICNGCGSCCSRLCAPYAPTGAYICQPANGCHINGDLCRKDSDCCGAAGTGLPGDGNVTCEITEGQTVGICRNPLSCNPEGNICHYKNYECSISSARNDCCGATGNSGACQLDPLGVPRCHAIGKCRNPGESCAFTADCCNNVPCIPDGKGGLACLTAPPGGPACSPQGGRCTVSADCCPGYLCITQLGSTDGVCGIVAPPPPTDAGTPVGDSGTPVGDSGVPVTDAAPPPPYDGGPLPCAAYGQICTVDGDCCNGVPCTAGKCYTPIR